MTYVKRNLSTSVHLWDGMSKGESEREIEMKTNLTEYCVKFAASSSSSSSFKMTCESN